MEEDLFIPKLLNKTQNDSDDNGNFRRITIFGEPIEHFVPRVPKSYDQLASAVLLSFICFFMILWLLFTYKEFLCSKFRCDDTHDLK